MSVVASHDTQQTVNALSISKGQNLIALACKSVVQIVRLESSGINDKCAINLAQQGKDNFSIYDLCWSSHHENKLAIANTNGVAMVVNIVGNRSVAVWEAGDFTRQVNKINWNYFDDSQVVCASQDGTVKTFDIRVPKESIGTFLGQSEACRDVQFSPFCSNVFASIYDNGSVQLWDARKPDRSRICNIAM